MAVSKQLVVNLSSLKLSVAQSSLLSKGLSFCPTPGEPDMGVLKEDLDRFHMGLRRKVFFATKRTVNVEKTDSSSSSSEDELFSQDDENPPFKQTEFKLKSTWNPLGPKVLEDFIFLNEECLRKHKVFAPKHKNLTWDEYKAIKELSANTDIVIKPADKGGAVVILDLKDYLNEGYSQLKDTNVYQKLDQCKTDEYYTVICRYLEYCYKFDREISKETYEYLTHFKPRTSRLYLLPKIHKKQRPPPGRPVISSNGSPTERISSFVDYFLKPYVCKTKSYIKDTNDFLNKLKEIGRTPANCIIFSLDVVSLYTNIPTDFGISLIEEFLNEKRDPNLKPSNSMLVKLLEFVLTLNDFEFNGDYYLQLFGTAIGTKVAPSYANLVMSIFEEKYVYTYKQQPLLWKRFIDDIFGLWPYSVNSLLQFVEHLNSCVDSLKFTLEYSYTKVSFLDVLVLSNGDGNITTDLYKKPTDARNYLVFNSAHPLSCKRGIPFGQFLRIRRICSSLEMFDKNAVEMAKCFLDRGYPADLVETSMIKARRMDRDILLAPKSPENKQNNDNTVALITTYNSGQNILGRIIDKHLPYLTRNPSLRSFNEVSILRSFRRPKNLRDLLVRASVKNTKKPGVSNKCINPTKCRYCPKINKTGEIVCTVTNRTYISKRNICCKSSNLVYAITCKTCLKQYVGQTGRTIMERFQGHFGAIKREEKTTLINDHFNRIDHNGVQDFEIHVMDFINLEAKSETGKALRLKLESRWINRLRSAFPDGLNYLE